MQQTLWQQGMDLMLFGMGTVFVFLTLLVISTIIMSAVVTRYFAEEPVALSNNGLAGTAPVSKRTIAVIQAAIQAHRTKHHK